MRKNFFFLSGIFAISLGAGLQADLKPTSPQEALALRRITEYWKDGDFATVKRQIADFLDKNPTSSMRDHLSAMLGDLYFQERNFKQALLTYQQISSPEIQAKTFFNQLQAQFEMKDYLGVIEKADKKLKSGQLSASQGETKVRYLLAEASFRQALRSKDQETKNHYLKLAKPHYKILTKTDFADKAYFPLAETYRLLREETQAAALYLVLAKKFPEHKERFIFQAAILQIRENKGEALKLFEKVYEMGGKRSRLAAFNQLILLFQTENYEKFLSLHARVKALMPEEKKPLLQFYEGRCYYAMGEYEQAVGPLQESVERLGGKGSECKTALLLLINCSRYLKDLSLLESSMTTFKEKFPGDKELPKALLLHAQMSRENGQFKKALSDLKALATEHPQSEDAASVLYDTALLLSQTGSYSEARATFRAFIEKFPNSERAVGAWRHLINSCIEELKTPAGINSYELRETFATVLADALASHEVLNAKEKQQYTLVLAKTLCELSRHEEALPPLMQVVSDSADPVQKAEGHLLIALCHQKLDKDDHNFISHGEKALSLNPHLTEKEILHLELYNAYLSRAMQTDEQTDKRAFLHLAAEHLYASETWKEGTIKQENFLWLTSHFYKLAMNGSLEEMEKAKSLYSHILSKGITPELEPEAIRYAEMLGAFGDIKTQVAFLEDMIRFEENSSNFNWKYKDRATLDLAIAYQVAGQTQKAINSFKFLSAAEKGDSSIVGATAKLHLSTLQYRGMTKEEKRSDNPELIAILHALKDLQIQKRMASEPIHLEAALTYAEIRSELTGENDRSKNRLFFLKRMKEDFKALDDPLSREYNEARSQYPEKDGVYLSYMHYLDAAMLVEQAELAKKENQIEKGEHFKMKAGQILQDMKKNRAYMKPYLSWRVEELENRIK